MPFPLPIDPSFRKEVIQAWLQDIDDRLELGQPQSAELSWKQAVDLYLQLGPGEGSEELENAIAQYRVKLDYNLSHSTNENNF